MASPARTPGKRGRLPAKQLPMRFVHQYAAAGALPPAVYPVDVSGGITDGWGMAGNGPDPSCTAAPDGVGDCTFAGEFHYRMAKAAAGQETEEWPSADQIVRDYLAYDHGRDEGAVIADLLLHWYRTGVILAFAPVDHTDPAQVDAAMQAFHGAYVGVSLTDDADQLFSEGRPWTVANGQRPDPGEGHCIVKVKAEGGAGYDTWVTWGALQDSTPVWTAECLDEAWVIVTHEDAAAANLDLAALLADIEALHGTGGRPPKPAPSPSPSPAPVPRPSPPPDAPPWFTRFWEDLLAWLEGRTS